MWHEKGWSFLYVGVQMTVTKLVCEKKSTTPKGVFIYIFIFIVVRILYAMFYLIRSHSAENRLTKPGKVYSRVFVFAIAETDESLEKL